jgi:hypothetical protein
LNRRFVKWGHLPHWLVRFSLLLSLIGCVRLAEPTRTPTRTPLPTPDELAIYVMLTDRYTAPYIIMQIHDMSADEAARILRALQAVEPPPRAEELHQQALNAYQQICAGKLLLPGSDSVLRADAYFMIDWGISRLVDYHEELERMRQ